MTSHRKTPSRNRHQYDPLEGGLGETLLYSSVSHQAAFPPSPTASSNAKQAEVDGRYYVRSFPNLNYQSVYPQMGATATKIALS